MFGAVQSYRGRSSFAAGVPTGTLLTGGMIDGIVSLLPLRVGYRASAFLLLIEPGSPRALPAELSVEREERVRVGSADVDCWVVTLRAGVMEERRWVSKDAPRVVRAQQVVAEWAAHGGAAAVVTAFEPVSSRSAAPSHSPPRRVSISAALPR